MLTKETLPAKLAGINDETKQATVIVSTVYKEDGVEFYRKNVFTYGAFDDVKIKELFESDSAAKAFLKAKE